MHFSRFFRKKPIARLILKCKISGSHTISDQSLLLSTIVLNDTKVHAPMQDNKMIAIYIPQPWGLQLELASPVSSCHGKRYAQEQFLPDILGDSITLEIC